MKLDGKVLTQMFDCEYQARSNGLLSLGRLVYLTGGCLQQC